jgi:hypothetical protein
MGGAYSKAEVSAIGTGGFNDVSQRQISFVVSDTLKI